MMKLSIRKSSLLIFCVISSSMMFTSCGNANTNNGATQQNTNTNVTTENNNTNNGTIKENTTSIASNETTDVDTMPLDGKIEFDQATNGDISKGKKLEIYLEPNSPKILTFNNKSLTGTHWNCKVDILNNYDGINVKVTLMNETIGTQMGTSKVVTGPQFFPLNSALNDYKLILENTSSVPGTIVMKLTTS